MSARGGNGRRRGGSPDARSLIARRRPSRPQAEGGGDAQEAAPPAEAVPEEAAPEASPREGAAAEKTTRRRRPRAAKPEAATPEEAPTAAEPGDGAEGAPAGKTTRRRRSRAAAPEEASPPEGAGPPEEAAAADREAEDAPAEKTTRRRRSRAAPPAESAPQAEPAAAETEVQPARAATSPPTRRRTAEALAAVEERLGRLEQLGAEIAGQRAAILRLGESVDELAARLDRAARKPRLGVFVDVPNVLYGVEAGEPPIDMGKLLAMLREDRDLVRATAYAPVSDDPREAVEQQKFVAPFVPYAYRIVTKPLKRFADGSVKGNFDVEMAIDLVTMSERLDVVAVVSGDSDFARAVEMVQSRGVRVEVVAFAGSTSVEMRALADHYVELDRFAAQLR